jgi:hypothetical protein
MRPAAALVPEQLALSGAESVLLIDDCEPEIDELDVFFDQGMRAHN